MPAAGYCYCVYFEREEGWRLLLLRAAPQERKWPTDHAPAVKCVAFEWGIVSNVIGSLSLDSSVAVSERERYLTSVRRTNTNKSGFFMLAQQQAYCTDRCVSCTTAGHQAVPGRLAPAGAALLGRSREQG